MTVKQLLGFLFLQALKTGESYGNITMYDREGGPSEEWWQLLGHMGMLVGEQRSEK